MPGYRKTKDVDFEKMQTAAKGELAYQKGYAEKKLKESESSYRNTGQRTLTKKERATFERVAGTNRKTAVGKKKPTSDSTSEVLSSVGKLLRKSKERYGQFKELGEK